MSEKLFFIEARPPKITELFHAPQKYVQTQAVPFQIVLVHHSHEAHQLATLSVNHFFSWPGMLLKPHLPCGRRFFLPYCGRLLSGRYLQHQARCRAVGGRVRDWKSLSRYPTARPVPQKARPHPRHAHILLTPDSKRGGRTPERHTKTYLRQCSVLGKANFYFGESPSRTGSWLRAHCCTEWDFRFELN